MGKASGELGRVYYSIHYVKGEGHDSILSVIIATFLSLCCITKVLLVL
jgi:hypothetical protein